MLEISLNGLEFHARHGYFEEERKTGNRFILDIKVSLTPTEDISSDDLGKTVDYGQLYKIADEEMKISSKLLETVVNRILRRVFNGFPEVNSCEVFLQKLNPPIGGICKSSGVKIIRNR